MEWFQKKDCLQTYGDFYEDVQTFAGHLKVLNDASNEYSLKHLGSLIEPCIKISGFVITIEKSIIIIEKLQCFVVPHAASDIRPRSRRRDNRSGA